MNIILNIILLGLGVIWFNHRQKSETRKPVLPVILAYIGGTLFVFFMSFVLQSDYLDGILYILCGGLSLLAFWIWTSISIIYKNTRAKTTGYIFTELAQCALLLVPILILCASLSGARLKIGG
jgi:hypothetical protein